MPNLLKLFCFLLRDQKSAMFCSPSLQSERGPTWPFSLCDTDLLLSEKPSKSTLRQTYVQNPNIHTRYSLYRKKPPCCPPFSFKDNFEFPPGDANLQLLPRSRSETRRRAPGAATSPRCLSSCRRSFSRRRRLPSAAGPCVASRPGGCLAFCRTARPPARRSAGPAARFSRLASSRRAAEGRPDLAC